MSEARPARFGPPLAVQIIALLVAVLIVGQLATLAVILLLPPPRPPIYRVEDVAAAFKGEQNTPRYGPKLARSTAAAPLAERAGERFRVAELKVQLARLLSAPEDRVRLVIEPRPFYGSLFGGGPRRRPPRDDRTGMMGPPEAAPETALGPPPGPPPDPSSATLRTAAPNDPDAPWMRHRSRFVFTHRVAAIY